MSKKIPSKKAYKVSYIISLIAAIFCLLIGIPTITVGGLIFVLFGAFFLFLYYTYKKTWMNYDSIYKKTTKKTVLQTASSTFQPNLSSVNKPVISDSENSLSFKVAGVTYKSGRKSRQVMLKNMYFQNTPPFDEYIEITFERYDYEGELAIGVYANGLQIGNVPAKLVSKFDSYWTADYIADFEVYGGGDKNWGCTINVNFF